MTYTKPVATKDPTDVQFKTKRDVKTKQVLPYLHKANLALFATDYLRGPKEAPFNGKFLIGDFHTKVAELVNEHKNLCILAPRGHGKCAVAGTLITRADGVRVPVESWEGGSIIGYNPGTHKFEIDVAGPATQLPKEPCTRIRTKSGREVTVNHEHRFRLWDRWVYPSDLRIGDRIAVAKELPGLGDKQVPDAWLLGLLVGDGGLTGSNVVITTADRAIVEHLYAMYDVGHTPNTISYRLHGLQNRMREVGLMGRGSHDKRVPDCIFAARDEDIAAFLSGYFDADAHVNARRAGSVEYYSVSKSLLQDVQHLLTRLGVVSVLSAKSGKYQGRDHKSWRLTIRGQSITVLSHWLHPVGQRKEQLRALVRARGDCNDYGSSLDVLPGDALQLLKQSEDWFRRNELPRPNKKYNLTRGKARKLADADNSDQLRALANSPVLWDEVVAIEDAGDQHCYTITAERLENYVANDVVNHNSYLVTVAYTLWKAMQLEGRKKGIIFSGTDRQARGFLAIIKDEIEKNPKLQHLKPSNPKKWAETAITLTTGLTIEAIGYGSQARGGHPEFIVVDDGLNDEDMYSAITREKHIEYFHSAIENMITPGGQIMVVGTPFHNEDLYGALEKNPIFHFERFQAIIDEGRPTERALWPEVFPLSALAQNRQSIGEIRFARERMCIPLSSAASLFPDDLFVGDPTEQFQVVIGSSRSWWATQVGIELVYIGVDFSVSATTGEDYTVIFVMGVDKNGNRWIMDIFRGHRLGYQNQLSLINDYSRRYAADMIYVEANQAQRIWGEELQRLTDLPIKLFHTGAAKHSLEKGIPSLRVPLEARKIRIPRGDDHSVTITNMWRAEMQGMTMVDGEVLSTTKNDDLAMAYWITNAAINAGSFSFSFGEQDGDAEAFSEELKREHEVHKLEIAGQSTKGVNFKAHALVGSDQVAGLLAEDRERERQFAEEQAKLPPGMRPPTAAELIASRGGDFSW